MSVLQPDSVLAEYLQGCCKGEASEADVASNGVLEWFGRTFRGSERMLRFFRYDIHPHQQHKFTRAEAVAPFETKPAHKETQKDPPENCLGLEEETAPVDHVTAATPPSRRLRSDHPPPLTRGRRFKPIDSPDADVSLTSIEDISGVFELSTPPKCDTVPAPPPPRNVRRKHSTDSPESLRTPQVAGHKRNADTQAMHDTDASRPKQLRLSPTATVSKFSELFYISATGVLRQTRSTKHRGVTASSTATPITPSEPTFWDRDVQLHISYRICLQTQAPQFALIVYEHLTRNPRTRRNLMDEFQSTDDEPSDGQKTQLVVSSPPKTELPTPTHTQAPTAPVVGMSTPPRTPVHKVPMSDRKSTAKKTLSSSKASSFKRLRF